MSSSVTRGQYYRVVLGPINCQCIVTVCAYACCPILVCDIPIETLRQDSKGVANELLHLLKKGTHCQAYGGAH